MKLSKIYSLKKSKSNEIIYFTFQFIVICYRKTTHLLVDWPSWWLLDSESQWLPDSATPWLGESVTPRLGELTTPQLGELLREKRQHRNQLFEQEGRLFPSEIREKRPE